MVTAQEQLEDAAARRSPTTRRSVRPGGGPIHLTSGTTGRPKGVWSGLLEPAEAEALLAEERELWGFAADDVNLVLSPIHHSAPLRFAMGTLLAGGRVVVRAPGRSTRATSPTAIAERATDVDVLRAGPPPAAVRALGRQHGRARPLVASGWSPTPARRARSG